jgi:hypothetical protein
VIEKKAIINDMKKLNLPNTTLIALVVSCLLQAGAQLFALSVVASTVSKAPPSSFAILEGEYRYDSSAFWETVPMITFILFIIALVTNWKTQRRKLILLALALFIIGGLLAGFYLEPTFADMIKRGYSDQIDPVLQSQARRWYILDWMVWTLGVFAGLALLVALMRPVRVPVHNIDESSH